MEDLELVLGNLKDVAKELKEHVYSLLITVLCGEEIPHVQDQEQRPSGDTPHPRLGAVPALHWSSRE